MPASSEYVLRGGLVMMHMGTLPMSFVPESFW